MVVRLHYARCHVVFINKMFRYHRLYPLIPPLHECDCTREMVANYRRTLPKFLTPDSVDPLAIPSVCCYDWLHFQSAFSARRRMRPPIAEMNAPTLRRTCPLVAERVLLRVCELSRVLGHTFQRRLYKGGDGDEGSDKGKAGSNCRRASTTMACLLSKVRSCAFSATHSNGGFGALVSWKHVKNFF